MGAPKIAEIGNFWYKFAQKGYTPLSDFFYKIWVGEGVPSLPPPPRAKFHHCGIKNVGLQPQKSRNSNFWYKFAPKRKFWGPQKKYKPSCMQ